MSDGEQRRSGLGLNAQLRTVQAFAHCYWLSVIASFHEVESGVYTCHRSQLHRALLPRLLQGAVLLVVKLDCLARDVHFSSGLMESRVPFVAADLPAVDALIILAFIADKVAKLIFRRTKDVLQTARARGKVLGRPTLGWRPDGQVRGVGGKTLWTRTCRSRGTPP